MASVCRLEFESFELWSHSFRCQPSICFGCSSHKNSSKSDDISLKCGNIMTFKMASAHHFEYLKCKFWHSSFALYKISSKLDNPLGSYGQKYNIPIWCSSAKNKKYFTAHNFRQSHNLLQHTNFHQSRIIFDRNYIFNVTAVRHLKFSRILEILKFIFTLS